MNHGIGLQSAIWNNNLKSIFLLVSFPLVIAGMIWSILFVFHLTMSSEDISQWQRPANDALSLLLQYWRVIVSVVGVWFLIAWLSHQRIINKATRARATQRSDMPGVYNLLENLCISRGITMPKLFVIHSDALNAYASGISKRSFAITLTTGLISSLSRDELEAVIAHELAHIINRDVRLLIISIIFVGIISLISEIMIRNTLNFSWNSSKRKSQNWISIAIVIVVAAMGYLFALIIRMALSRRREYMADAGAVALTKNSQALIAALKKISGHSHLSNVDSEVQQMMFDNQKSFLGIFATHPPIKSRIAALENY